MWQALYLSLGRTSGKEYPSTFEGETFRSYSEVIDAPGKCLPSLSHKRDGRSLGPK